MSVYLPKVMGLDGDVRVAYTVDREVELTFRGYKILSTLPPENPDLPYVLSINGEQGSVTFTKEDLDLGQVDDTSDVDKPLSAAAILALADKVDVDDLDDAIGAGVAGAINDSSISAVLTGPLSQKAQYLTDQEREAKRQRALRAFHVALGTVDVTAVDIGWLPSDSIGEGAYATGSGSWNKRCVNVMQDTIRRAFQPSGVTGGTGYFGFGSSLILSGAGYIGGSGSLANITTMGLGRKALQMGNAAVWSFYVTGTGFDLAYSTDPTYGSFTMTVDGVATGGTTAVNGATSHGNVKQVRGLAVGTHTIVVTATGTVVLEGETPYNGDESVGIRVFEGAHSGYGAHDFQTNTAWADSLAIIPNLKLVIMTGNSNDYYGGRTVAQCKADTLANIALIRAKGFTGSIALLSYYDRPVPGGVTIPWQDFVDMYDEIAAADDDIFTIDLGADFGHKVSDTDTRGGLVNNTDYVHPTNAGHKKIGQRIAELVLPPGSFGSGGATNIIPDSLKPVSTPQAAADLAAAAGLPYTAIGNIAGALSFNLVPMGDYSIVATGACTLSGSGMPPVVAGRTATWHLRFVQDATGGRTFTHGSGIKAAGGIFPVMPTAAGAIEDLEYFFDGVEWWVSSLSNPTVSTAQVAAIAAVTGDQQSVYSAAFGGGAITLSAFLASTYGGFRLVLGGAVSFSAAAKPVIAAGRTYSFWIAFVQDATGGRVMTWNANILTAGGVDPVLSTAANAIDIGFFEWTGTELILTNFVKGVA